MTDQNNAPAVDPTLAAVYADRQATVDNLVASLQAHNPTRATVTPPRATAMKYSTATGEVEVIGPVADSGEPQRLHDDGRDIGWHLEGLQHQLDESAARINEFHFDQKTGQKVYRLSPAEREVAIRAHLSLQESLQYDAARLHAIREQRAEDARLAEARQAELAARAAFARGNAGRAQLLDEALARAEAEELARALINARRS